VKTIGIVIELSAIAAERALRTRLHVAQKVGKAIIHGHHPLSEK
jgi:hypothetical protein